MTCTHEDYYSCVAKYDRAEGKVVYLMICDCCGSPVKMVGEEPYSPRFDPHGVERLQSQAA